MTTKTQLLLALLVLSTTSLGCASKSAYLPLAAGDFGPSAQASVRRVSKIPNSDALILEPGENVRIRGLHKGRYLCSNGKALVCDQIGLTAYCSCPGVWQRR
jgi:hypothetical protein